MPKHQNQFSLTRWQPDDPECISRTSGFVLMWNSWRPRWSAMKIHRHRPTFAPLPLVNHSVFFWEESVWDCRNLMICSYSLLVFSFISPSMHVLSFSMNRNGAPVIHINIKQLSVCIPAFLLLLLLVFFSQSWLLQQQAAFWENLDLHCCRKAADFRNLTGS